MARPQPATYPAYAENYVKLVDAESVNDAVQKYSSTISHFIENIPEVKADYRYAEGKWTVKELLLHIIDTERIFAYRALAIARGDKTPLPGFDENTYAAAGNADKRSWKSLLEEFKAVRLATDLLLNNFSEEQLQQTGTTNNQPNTVNAIAFTVLGHLLHHKKILEERYQL